MDKPLTPIFSSAQLQRLIEEAALDYYAPEDLAAQLGVPHDVINTILARSDVRVQVAAAKRAVVESGKRFRLITKRMAEEVVQDMAAIAMDSAQPAAARVKAAELIIRWADLEPAKVPMVSVTVNQGLRAALDAGEARLAGVAILDAPVCCASNPPPGPTTDAIASLPMRPPHLAFEVGGLREVLDVLEAL